jgi:hypothetical protein
MLFFPAHLNTMQGQKEIISSTIKARNKVSSGNEQPDTNYEHTNYKKIPHARLPVMAISIQRTG